MSNSRAIVNLINDRPEDLALASPLHGEFTINNRGNARFNDFKVTDTDPLTFHFYFAWRDNRSAVECHLPLAAISL
ncbi:MAG: hypothetical protein U5L01_16430 [Rheinheimera sp.]|nr:hypothetical protein [Rheinheimera sp.]